MFMTSTPHLALMVMAIITRSTPAVTMTTGPQLSNLGLSMNSGSVHHPSQLFPTIKTPSYKVCSFNFFSLRQLFTPIPSPVLPDGDDVCFRSLGHLDVSISSL